MPLTFGIDTWLLPSHGDRILAGVLGQVVVIGVIVWTIRRRRDAARAWVLFGLMFVTLATLVGLTRVSSFGPGDAGDVRYVTLDAFFLPIVLAFALRPPRALASSSALVAVTSSRIVGHPENDPPRHRNVRQKSRAGWAIGAVVLCIVTALYGIALVYDLNRDTTVQGDFASRVLQHVY